MPIQHFILFDGTDRDHLLPLTATRAVADLRIGIVTIKEKWEHSLHATASILTQPYLQPKYPSPKTTHTIYINAHFLPNTQLVQQIIDLPENKALCNENGIIAVHTTQPISTLNELHTLAVPTETISTKITYLKYPWNIFTFNGQEIRNDIQLLGLKPNPEKLSATNTILGNEIYVEDSVQCECSILNSTNGPIYLGKHSEVMEGCTIRAPFALCEHASLKMQAKIYGDTTIGPHCKVGGEVSNSVLLAYSNKGHDGFLGNSVIGEWCNLGADTNNSNLKNNYGKVKAYNYPSKNYIDTQLQFCGLIMGDHAKAAINTQFNTGTVVGVFANVFSAGFPPKFVPDFSWSNDVFELDKAYEVAQRVMERRAIDLNQEEKNILQYIFENRTK